MKKIHLSEYYQSIETNIINLLLTSIHFLLDLQQVPFIYEAINTLKSVPHWGHPALGLIYLYQVMSCRQECPLILFSLLAILLVLLTWCLIEHDRPASMLRPLIKC